MPEWWSYSLSDFLLFSPRTYYRLIERHNQAVWPTHVVALGLALTIAGLLQRPSKRQGQVVAAILALLWAWVGWTFVWQRYATINWAARYLVGLFALEVVGLIWVGIAGGALRFGWRWDPAGSIGLTLLVGSLALYPGLAQLAGRGWRQAEVFGVTPDPTVIATLGVLLLAETPPNWGLLVAPLLWCLAGGATLLAMGSPEAWILLSVAGVAIGAATWSRRQ